MTKLATSLFALMIAFLSPICSADATDRFLGISESEMNGVTDEEFAKICQNRNEFKKAIINICEQRDKNLSERAKLDALSEKLDKLDSVLSRVHGGDYLKRTPETRFELAFESTAKKIRITSKDDNGACSELGIKHKRFKDVLWSIDAIYKRNIDGGSIKAGANIDDFRKIYLVTGNCFGQSPLVYMMKNHSSGFRDAIKYFKEWNRFLYDVRNDETHWDLQEYANIQEKGPDTKYAKSFRIGNRFLKRTIRISEKRSLRK